MKENLVIGIGNLLLCDDALGPLVVRRLAGSAGPVGRMCDFLENYSCGLDLLDEWSGYRRVVLIDSCKSLLQPPGTCLEFTFEQLVGGVFNPVHAHGLNVPTLWQLAATLGLPLPESCLIIGVVACDTGSFSETLSPQLQAVFETVVEKVRKRLGHFISSQLLCSAGIVQTDSHC